jgi:hypothetical protein
VHPARTIELQSVTPSYSKKHLEGQPRVCGRTQNTDSYDSNTRAYRVFNKSTGLVEVSYDIVFDETNGSQVEQVDIDELDDEEAPCVVLRNMSIGDVCPKVSEEPTQAQDQLSSSNQASPPTQDEDHAQDNENEDQEDEPPQEEDNDQVGDDHDKDKEDEQEI